MEFRITPLNETDVKIISTWKYGGEYAIYDEDSYEEKVKNNSVLLNPSKMSQFTCFYLDQILIGYINLLEEENEVFFGIGVNPKYCNQGYGQEITKLAIQMSKKKYPSKPLYLEVRSWNKRAIHCYEKAGFQYCGELDQTTPLGKGHFIKMKA